jgi:2,5-diketo-D-gluconate reductase A
MTTDDYARPAATLSNGFMPLLGFGTWQISNREAPQAIAHALQAGYRHIDTATAYHNEPGIGKALASSTVARESVFVTTKLPPGHAGRAAPRVWEQLVRARQDGLARAVGVSNYSLAQIDELTEATGVTPEVNQIRWGPSIYDAGVVSGLLQRGVVLEGYSPFKVSNLRDPTLVSIASEHDATTAQVIVAWHIAHGFVVIPKSSRRERIVANAAGARIELTAAEVAAIDGLSAPGRVGSLRRFGRTSR